MHRQPLPRDIVRHAAVTCIVREIRGRKWVLEISPNPGVADPVLAPMPIPDYRTIPLLGIAAPSSKRSKAPQAPKKAASGPRTLAPTPTQKPASETHAGSYGASGIDPSDLF